MNDVDLPIPIVQNDLLRLFNWHHLEPPVKKPSCAFVAAGSYTISRTAGGYLTTAPGAGVGLALYDKIAGVGGVAHFLLAEPPAGVAVRQSEYFVSSAMPEFIEALLAAGACKDQLVAAVAGGSCLVGDLSLDNDSSLGTQTIDATVAILQQEQISVSIMEVGGLRPLTLLLDTGSWKPSIQLIGAASEGPLAEKFIKPSAAAIELAIDAVKPIPQVALKVIHLLGNENTASFAELTEEIKQDQVVASKILRYSNSALFGQLQIDSIERALLLLGEEHLLEIAVSTAADLLYSGQEGGYALMRGGLYRHALATALTAREIAGFIGAVDPGTAYTAGLLHDIGKVVLDRFVADSLPFFYRHQDQLCDFADLEQERFGTDHMAVGLKLAGKWQLPDSLSQAIYCHHCPEEASETNLSLVHIVHLADLLATAYLSGVDREQIAVAKLSQRLEQIGLPPNQLPLIIDRIPWQKLMYM